MNNPYARPSLTTLRGTPEGDLSHQRFIERYQTSKEVTRRLRDLRVPQNFNGREVWKQWYGKYEPLDQGSCGSCWSVACTDVLSCRLALWSNQGIHLRLSAGKLVLCVGEKHGCNGGDMYECWKYLKNTGVPSEECVPYNLGSAWSSLYTNRDPVSVPKCQDVVGADGDRCVYGEPMRVFRAGRIYSVSGVEEDGGSTEDIMREIYLNGPVMAGFYVTQSFLEWNGLGVFSVDPKEKQLFGHAVVLLGWGDSMDGEPYWLCRNSWGARWGDGGYFRLRRGMSGELERNVTAGIPEIWGMQSFQGQGISTRNQQQIQRMSEIQGRVIHMSGYTQKYIDGVRQGKNELVDVRPPIAPSQLPEIGEFIAGNEKTWKKRGNVKINV